MNKKNVKENKKRSHYIPWNCSYKQKEKKGKEKSDKRKKGGTLSQSGIRKGQTDLTEPHGDPHSEFPQSRLTRKENT